MIYLVVCLNIAMLFFAFKTDADNKKTDVALVEAASTFFGIFFIVSGILWMASCYSLTAALTAETIIDTIILCIAYYICKKRDIPIFKIKKVVFTGKMIVSRLILVAVSLLSVGAYATFGIGRNDGNALVQAYAFHSGNYSNEFEIEEYGMIEEGSKYSEYFKEAVSEMDTENYTGTYWTEERTEETEEGTESSTVMMGSFGCNPVYASFLELGMTLFGTTKATYLNAFLVFFTLIFVDEILLEIGCRWSLRTSLTALLGASPLLVYSSHTAVQETFMMLCLTAFIYYLLCKKNRQQIIAAVFSSALSVTSVGAFTIVPIFVIACWIKYLKERRFRSIQTGILTIAGYMLSFFLFMQTAFENTIIVYRQGLFFLKDSQVTVFVIILAVVSLALTGVLFGVYRGKLAEKVIDFSAIKGKIIVKFVVLACLIASLVFTVINGILSCETYKDVTMMTLPVIAAITGGLLIPYVIYETAKMKYKLGMGELIILTFFASEVLVYSVILRPFVSEYYFEARFLLPFLTIVIMTAGIMLRGRKADAWYVPAIALVIVFVPYTTTLLNMDTETRLEWQNVENVICTAKDHSDENTIILLEKDLMKDYYLPLKYSLDAKVFPFEGNEKIDFVKDVEAFGKKVIYISDTRINGYKNRGNILYLCENNKSSVKETDISPILSLPSKYTSSVDKTVEVLELSDFGRLMYLNDGINGRLYYDKLCLKVQNIEIENNIAKVEVSVLPSKRKIYYNDKGLALSYHLEFEDESLNEYDHNRINLGSFGYLNGQNVILEIPLGGIEEDEVTAIIDVVHDGYDWYSWIYKDCPEIVFTFTEDGWEYKTEK